MRCDVSIRPRSARSESAAEDLYALTKRGINVHYLERARKLRYALNVIAHACQEVRLIQRRLHICLSERLRTHIKPKGTERTFVLRNSRT